MQKGTHLTVEFPAQGLLHTVLFRLKQKSDFYRTKSLPHNQSHGFIFSLISLMVSLYKLCM